MLVRMSVFVVVGALVGGVQYLAAESSVLEEIETKDGKRFAGRVVGYDVESKSYVLRTRGGDLKIPESSILTVHAVSHADESPDEAGGSPESLVGSSESPVTPPVVSVEPGHQESLPVQPETHRVRAPRRHAELAEILEAATTEGADAFRHEDRLALEVARDALKEGDIGAARFRLFYQPAGPADGRGWLVCTYSTSSGAMGEGGRSTLGGAAAKWGVERWGRGSNSY